MALIHNGRGQMPAFPELSPAEVTALLRYLGTPAMASPKPEQTATAAAPVSMPASHASGPAAAGGAIFAKDCGFCHGRDAMGGESGPDLTRSRLVRTDVGGDKISEVVLNGRIDKGMPAFKFSSDELLQIAAFIHAQEAAAAAVKKGGRRGVEVADLQTGNAAAGKQFFDGPGGCVKCHSATGDLAGIATRYEGLQLEERMLYPRGAMSQVTVTLPSGEKVSGVLAYQDEFTIGLRDSSGIYHSWETSNVKFSVDSPVDAHVDLFPKYTDADIHNLMAYLQTMQ
jgi:mono/diheme cytochrome c family protein